MPATGSYGCVDVPGFTGWFIRKATHSDFDHCFIVLDGTPGREIILEAAPGGSRISGMAKYKNFEMVFSPDYIKVPALELMRTAAWAGFTGVSYGFDDIALLSYVLTVGEGHAPAWAVSRVRDDKTMICSQLVAEFGAQFGVNWLCGQADPQLVTPGMLATRAQKG